jgi:amino acid permease
LLLFFIGWSNGTLHSVRFWPSGRFIGHGFESAVQVIATLPVLLVAYICQMSLSNMLQDLHYVRGRQVDTASASALAITTAVYAVLGIFGFALFGQKVHADVIRDFSTELLTPLVGRHMGQAVFMAVRIAFLISLIGIFPLQMAPLRDSLWKLLFRQDLTGPGLWLVTYILLAFVYWAATWVSSIWEPLVIIGSTAGVLMALIFPGLLAIATPELLTERSGARWGRATGGTILVVVGLAIGVFGIMRVVMYPDPLEQ